MAMLDLDPERKTVVDRSKLTQKLLSNKVKHIQRYEEAMAGYKDELRGKIEAAFKKAQEELPNRLSSILEKIDGLDEEGIRKQRDSFTVADAIYVEMPVPRLHADAYDAAIDMAHWDTRDTIELNNSEFQKFIRDKWDWSNQFHEVTGSYIGKIAK